MREWPARDVLAALRNLPDDSATARAELGDAWDWTHFAANIAELVDIASYWVHVEHARATTDPNDPEVRRRAKQKPPPIPLIPPVAHRPESVAARYRDQYELLCRLHGALDEPAPSTGGRQWVSTAEFDAAIGEL